METRAVSELRCSTASLCLRVFRWAAQALDDRVIRMATARMPRTNSQDTRLTEAAALLRQPDWFLSRPEAPDDLAFSDPQHFRFRSPLPGPWEENNVVLGRLFRAGPHWEQRPSVALIHGWNGERQYRWQFPWLGRRLARHGVNAAMIELPYHGRRKPSQAGAPRNLISSDLAHTVLAARQAVADSRALLAWLAAHGSQAPGVWGFSFGGWLAGLLACHEPGVRFAALLTPVPRMDLAIEQLPFCEPIRRGLRGGGVPLDLLNLSAHSPRMPSRDLLLIESSYDTFVPPQALEDLWQAWGRPEIWRLPHGHISVLLAWPVLERTVQWLVRKAQAR